MVCLGCHRVSPAVLCQTCVRSLRPAADRILPTGIPLIAGFEHSGAAKTLIHHLKYRGITPYADVVAEALADRLPRAPLVPVPRALSRRLRYGVDPAGTLADALGSRLGLPVLGALGAPLHTPRRAGRDHARPVSPFRATSTLRYPVVLVDDVVTTGSTVAAAVEAIGPGLVAAVAAANLVANVVREGSRVEN